MPYLKLVYDALDINTTCIFNDITTDCDTKAVSHWKLDGSGAVDGTYKYLVR